MYCKFNPVVTQKARIDAAETQIGTGAGMEVRSGSPPADPSVTATGTLLASPTPSSTFGTTTAGVSGGAAAFLAAAAIGTVNGVATGTPGYLRIKNSSGVGIVDLDIGATGSGAAVIMTPATVTNGAPVNISSLTITEGA